MNKAVTLATLMVVGLLSVGCTPKVVVRKSNGVQDSGIKYYRPKPYLLIVPEVSTASVQESRLRPGNLTTGSDQLVSIELQYLPDFTEEYSINVRPGLGNADVSIRLDHGWNLTELNQKVDSQHDENLSATADLVKAIGAITPTGGTASAQAGYRAENYTKRWVVQATNIPLGYYEAVIVEDCGQKNLQGWRYVGFAPFNASPARNNNWQSLDRDQDGVAIYGLVFERGVMTFRTLDILKTDDGVANEMTEVFHGSKTYQLKSTVELVRNTIEQELAGKSVRGKDVAVKSIETVETPFPDTLQFRVVTEPPLTQKLKDMVRERAAGVPGAPSKVQIQFN